MRSRHAVAALAVALASIAQTPAPQLVRSWSSDWGSTTPFSRVLDLEVAGKAAFVAADTGFDLRAVEVRTGEILWRTPEMPGGATTVTSSAGRVFAAGAIDAPGRGSDWFVGAWDPEDGALLWQDTFDHRGLADGVRGLAVAGGRAFAVGQVNTYIRYGAEYRVRAYDAATGRPLWDDLKATGGDDAATHVVASDDRVWVLGTIAPQTIPDLFLRCYEAASGRIRWSQRTDLADELPTGLARLGNRLAISAESGGNWLVQARDAVTGRRLWQDLDADALQPIGVVAGRGAFVVAGTLRTPTEFEMLTRAYDATTGGVLWQDRFAVAGGDIHATALALSRGTVVVAGTAYDPPPYGHYVRVRGIDLVTGTLRWEYGYDVPGADEEAVAVAQLRHRLVVGGLSRPFDGGGSALLLGYRTPR